MQPLVDVRVYPLRAAQEAPLPRLQYHQGGRDLPQSLTGPVSPATARITFDVYGVYADAKAVAEALRQTFTDAAANGWGYLGASGVYVQHAALTEGGRDSLEPPVHGDEYGNPSVSLEAFFRYEYQ